MDNLPAWALWIITAVALSPGLALLMVRPIARLLHRVLWTRPEVAPPLGGRASCEPVETRRLSRSPTTATMLNDLAPRLVINRIERVPKPQPVSGPITVKKRNNQMCL